MHDIKAERAARWREARGWFERSLNIWNTLRAAGTLSRAETARSDEATREIASCDLALHLK